MSASDTVAVSCPRRRWPAWVPFGATLVLVAVSLVLPVNDTDRDGLFEGLALSALLTLQAVTFAAVGLVIGRAWARDSIAWMFALVGIFVALYLVAERYQYYALVLQEGEPPLGELAAWLQAWLYVPALGIVVIVLPQVFPTGRPVSRRRAGLWLSALSFVGLVLTDALAPGRLDQSTIENPVGIDRGIHETIAELAPPVYVVATLVGFASIVARWRRAGARRRQQLKWFAYFGALLPLSVIVTGVFEQVDKPGASVVPFAAGTGAFLGLPIATAISILRHQLFDIDVVINSTLVYGALTVLLAASCLGLVLVLQTALTPVTSESELAVAGSTLAVAALFRPLRSRIQAVVDRRFYRERYDAARTLDGFAGRLRDELDVEALGVDLRRAVHDTMQPAHVSLWLRDTP